MNATETTATEETAAAKIERVAADLGLTIAAEFVPFSQSRNAKPGPFSRDGKPWRSLNWRVTLSRNGRAVMEPFDYSQGEGHCPAYKSSSPIFGVKRYGGGLSIARDKAIAAECETGRAQVPLRWSDSTSPGKPIPAPSLADILASLSMDSSVLDYANYEQWGSDLGYDPDSRAGEAIYRLCLSQALALRAAIGEAGIEALREAAQDY